MGLMDSLLGNASEVDLPKMQAEMAHVLVDGETIQVAFKIFRDSLLFTNRRMIIVDVQGMTGSKVELHSVPYKSITQFSIETAGGMFDSDADLKIWLSGQTEPIQKKVSKKSDPVKLQKVIAWYVLGGA